MAVEGVLLDLFGTVVAYGDVVAGTREAWEGIHAVLSGLGSTLTYDEFVPLWEASFAAPLAVADDVHGTVFQGKMARFMRACELPVVSEAVNDAVVRCLAGWDAYLALPEDAIPALRDLRRRYRVALVSNFDHPPYARELLGRLGLAPLFDAIVISGELRVDKPNPRIFYHALNAIACPADRAVHVGDSLESDIEGARRAGCVPVLIDMRGRHPEFAGHRIARLSELPELLLRMD